MSISLTSFGDDAPSGENLEYDPDFTALEIAAQPGEERQMGDEILAAEEPDYKDIIAKAHAVLDRSHDLRAAIYLAHAELRRNGLLGFAEVTGYIRGCLTEFWDTCHPELDEDDDNDPTMRVNTMVGLADPQTILNALRIAPMTESRAFGRITLRDLMLSDGELTPHDGDAVPDAATISAAFQDTPPERLSELLAAARQARTDINDIDAVFSERTPGQGPNLGELQKMIARIADTIAKEVGEPEPAAEAASAPAADDDPWGTAPAPATGAQAQVGGIASPQDVRNALDRIMEYYAAAEPSSPVPIFLKRAKRLVGADFMTIMNDMAPSGVDNVKLLGGAEEESAGDSWGAAPEPPAQESSSSDW